MDSVRFTHIRYCKKVLVTKGTPSFIVTCYLLSFQGTRAQSTKVALDGEEVEEAGDIYSDRYQIEDVSQENENSCEAMTTSLGQHG